MNARESTAPIGEASLALRRQREAETTAIRAAPERLLINIDNGGTLTDFCVIGGERVWRTKSVTTPYDLSKCLFDGLRKVARTIYGQEDVQRLLLATDCIRYSTTQGTNALVERKGPRLGLIAGGGLNVEDLQYDAHSRELFAALVGDHVVNIPTGLDEAALDRAATEAMNHLSSVGATRIVVAYAGDSCKADERALKRILLHRFPPHMLGALPVLYSSYSFELVEDRDPVRRVWTALFNAFLHPAMERFLYSAERRLREHHARNPLLIFRNDGYSARVARTIAIKTYSSGPRAGAEGAKALAQHYGVERLIAMDVGGTTTDFSLVEDGAVRTEPYGRIEGVPTSFPLCEVVSVGVGGSSIIRVENGTLRVGPESVGGAPGPACFGLGGTEATITDAFLFSGLLDPATYFGGELKIDPERARAAIAEKVAKPLGLDAERAVRRMEDAWVAKLVASLKAHAVVDTNTALAAFGGAGPFVVCRVAEAAGIARVLIPGLAAVFSAYGIAFSDLGHEFLVALSSNDQAALDAAREEALAQARRAMFAEGASLDQCRVSMKLQVVAGTRERTLEFDGHRLPEGLEPGARLTLRLVAVKPIAHARIEGAFGQRGQTAVAVGRRRVMGADGWRELPLYRVEEQPVGAQAAGPCVLEEAYFTARIDHGWSFEINQARDILLVKRD